MVLRALLMRLLLIVAIAANGWGIAGASMHKEHLQGSTEAVTRIAVVQEAVGAPPCHGASASDPAAIDHGHPQDSDRSGEGPSPGDCCQAGDCGSCIHHCAAALPGPPLADFAVQYRQTAEIFLSAHPPAVLATLFRPPIG